MKTTPFVQPWKTLKQSCKTHTHRTQSAATATLSAQAQLRPSGGSDLETAEGTLRWAGCTTGEQNDPDVRPSLIPDLTLTLLG